MIATTVRPRLYVVQHNADRVWLDATRDDIFLRADSRPNPRDAAFLKILSLETARFRTHAAADRFIARCRGFLHCGGDGIAFRVLYADRQPARSLRRR